ncbi:MAG: hypothetical protein V3V99_02680 [candidate division Zixibacteria bacterium]
MQSWLNESREIFSEQDGEFCVFVDMRRLIPVSEGPRMSISEGQKLYKAHGMQRSIVILDNPVLTMQFKQIAHETGIYQWERYIDASANPNWEKAGLDWLEKSIDPDKKVPDISKSSIVKPANHLK